MTEPETTITLYRPVGPEELALVRESGFRAFPPRLPEHWNFKASGTGYVTRFRVRKDFADRYPVQIVGGSVHEELWVPAGDLPEFNENIVGPIEIVAAFFPEESR